LTVDPDTTPVPPAAPQPVAAGAPLAGDDKPADAQGASFVDIGGLGDLIEVLSWLDGV
jgi:hypothetical protein